MRETACGSLPAGDWSMAAEIPRPSAGGAYSYRGAVSLDYLPERDGEPDPGEIVWTWVPFEEDERVGKDRPLICVGTAVDAPGDYVGLMLSSQDHGDDHGWVFLGAGAWDDDSRPSWVRTDRLLGLPPDGIRRECVALDRERFRRLLAEVVADQRK
ncbi:MAG: type II toxin-antitoxin system PemK/MazF family toxin [Candidatus Nanopelagicales bacterium]